MSDLYARINYAKMTRNLFLLNRKIPEREKRSPPVGGRSMTYN